MRFWPKIHPIRVKSVFELKLAQKINITSSVGCCVILGFFIRLIKRIVSNTKIDLSTGSSQESQVRTEITMNTLVTTLHILLIITYTILNFLEEILYPKIGDKKSFTRIETTYFFVTGILDIFVSYMIWFMLDDNSETTLMLKDELSQNYHPIVDVIDLVATNHHSLDCS